MTTFKLFSLGFLTQTVSLRDQCAGVATQTSSLRYIRDGDRVLSFVVVFLPSAVSAQTPQATPPPPAPPRSVQFPKPVEKTLANGLRVIVIDRPGTPLVTAQLLIKNGGEVDPQELAGLGNMAADLITKGTEKRTATADRGSRRSAGRRALFVGALGLDARWRRCDVIESRARRGDPRGCRETSDVQRRGN